MESLHLQPHAYRLIHFGHPTRQNRGCTISLCSAAGNFIPRGGAPVHLVRLGGGLGIVRFPRRQNDPRPGGGTLPASSQKHPLAPNPFACARSAAWYRRLACAELSAPA